MRSKPSFKTVTNRRNENFAVEKYIFIHFSAIDLLFPISPRIYPLSALLLSTLISVERT